MRSNHNLACIIAALALALATACSDDDSVGNNNNNNHDLDCGNGVVDGIEECDDATANSDVAPNACRTDCTLPFCGDDVVDDAAPYSEQCEPPGVGGCNASCQLTVTTCDEPESYDEDCADATTGQWCWDGGMGGALFCGCDPDYGNTDCQIDGYEYCNPDTNLCEAPPECGTDANEPNDSEDAATTATLDTPITGAVCSFDDDWFEFTTGASHTAAYVLATWTDDGETDLDLYVTTCDGTTIAAGESYNAADEALAVRDLEASTTYCVLVNHYQGPAVGDDVSYTLQVTGEASCTLDSDCTGALCPFVGDRAGLCTVGPLDNAGCGDAAPGDNESSSMAEVLTSDASVLEGTCDGHPDGPADVDWFTFTVTDGDAIHLTVDQTGSLDPGDVDVYLLDSNGYTWLSSATTGNPETIDGTGLPAGSYYVVVYWYDMDSANAASDTYEIVVSITDTNCTSRNDCARWNARGECSGGVCQAFDGNASQGPGDFCDSSDDCDPSTTGSEYLSSLCFSADPARGDDNVCVIDCTDDSDCTPYSMLCAIIDDTATPPGICLAPCESDAGCGGLTCNTVTGHCEQ